MELLKKLWARITGPKQIALAGCRNTGNGPALPVFLADSYLMPNRVIAIGFMPDDRVLLATESGRLLAMDCRVDSDGATETEFTEIKLPPVMPNG